MTRYRWTSARRATAALFLGALVLGAQPWFPWLRGSTTATDVAGVLRLTDPLAAVEYALATGELPPSVWVGAALLVAFAALAGPVFCGWVCPLGLLLDLNDALRRKVRRLLRLRPGTSPGLPRELRYLALGLCAGFALVAGLPAFEAVSPIHLATRAVVFGAGWSAVVLLALAAIEWGAPRVWCRSLCPLGALYSAVGRWAPLRVRIDPARAGRTPCRQCTVRCPMGIAVMEDFALAGRRSIDDPDCTRCGSCLDICPGSVLSMGLRDHASPPPTDPKPAIL